MLSIDSAINKWRREWSAEISCEWTPQAGLAKSLAD
jgi:hypothetical protein